MALDLFKLLGTIEIDNKDAINALDETSEKGQSTQSKLSSAFSKMGSFAATAGKTLVTGMAVAGTAMAGLTTKAVGLAGDLEQNMGGSEQVFGKFAGKMQDTAKNAFSNMGLATSDYLATANKMGALFQGAGFSIEDSMNISSDAMQRAADVASIMGIDTGAAMEAIAGAAKGNFTMMDNLGVAMNDTTLNAYALSKGIDKTTQDMTNQEKIGLAMEMFMEKTAYAAGNYAKENETLAGSLGTAKSALTNFLDGSGDVDQLVTAFSNAANVIVNNVKDIAPRLISGITDLVGQVAPMIAPLIQELSPVIIDGAVALIDGLVSAFPTVISALLDCAPMLVSAAGEIFGKIVASLPSLIETLVSALPSLIPALVSGLTSMIVALCTNIVDIIMPIIDSLPVIIESIMTALISNLPAILMGLISLVGEIVVSLPQIFASLIEGVVAIFTGIWDAIVGIFSGVADFFGGIFGGAKDEVESSDCWGGVADFFGGVWDGICGAFSAVGNWFGDTFSAAKDAAANAWSDAKENFGKVCEGVQGAFSKIGDWFGDKFSKAKENAANAWSNAKETFSNIKDKVTGAFSKVGGWFKDQFSTAFNNTKNAFSTIGNVFNKVKEAITKPIEKAKETIKGIVDKVVGFFKNMKIGLPKIKLPHFNITGKLSIAPPSIPKLSIDWYAKAMNDPMIMNDPTIFGYNPATNSFMGGGEAGSEVVSGTSTLMNMIRAAVATQNETLVYYMQKLVEILADYFPQILEEMGNPRPAFFDPDMAAAELAIPMNRELGRLTTQKGRGR